ncbi:MAG: glycosyltransferase family 39 protein [Bacteroidota bacterium]
MIDNITYKQSYFYFLLIMLAILLFFHIGATPIYILDEAKNAECAREMLQNHNWIIPTFNGELRTDKPPLHYFFMAISYSVFGYTEFAARFFSVIMGLLTVCITYFYTKKFTTPFIAFCAVLVLIASTHFIFEFRLAVPDPYLIFFIAFGLFSAFSWIEENKISQLYISAAALALACLTKGPIALALPGLCIFVWIIWTKKWKHVSTMHLIGALILFLLIALPWYIAVDRATNGEWTKGFFIENNLNRFADPQEGHGGFFGLTLVFFIFGMLPFLVFVGGIIKNRKIVFSNSLVKFSGIIVLIFIIFFSFASTRLPNYAMPCYPFAAIVIGKYIAGLLNGNWIGKKYPYYILIAFTICIPVAGYFALMQEDDLNFLAPIALILLIVPLLLIVFLFLKKDDFFKKQIAWIFGVFCILNFIGIAYLYPVIYRQNPVAATIEQVKDKDNIFSYQIFNSGYRFYLDKNIPRTFYTDTLKQWLQLPGNAIVITRLEFLPDLKNLPLVEIARHRDIFELPTTVILKKVSNEEY